jgi:hypothetical protein
MSPYWPLGAIPALFLFGFPIFSEPELRKKNRTGVRKEVNNPEKYLYSGIHLHLHGRPERKE